MSQLASYRSLLQWLSDYWRDGRWQAFINLALGLSLVLLSLALVIVTRSTIDSATGQVSGLPVDRGLLLIGGILALQIVLSFISRWVKATLGLRSQNLMQQRLFARLLRGEWNSLRHYHSGDVLNRLMKDVGSLVTLLTEDLPTMLTTLAQFLGAFLLLYYMDKHLALLVVLIAPFFILVSKIYVRRLRKLTHKVRNSESKIQTLMQESVQHSLVIKTLERSDHMLQRLSGLHAQLRQQVLEKTTYSSISATLMSLGFGLGYIITFAWGIYQLKAGTSSYGQFLAFIQLVGQLQSPMRVLSQYIPVLINATTACERLMELENMPIESQTLTQKLSKETPQAGRENTLLSPEAIDTLTFEQVSYRYPNGNRSILQNFSYSFPPSSITAIQGETGVGKTTLIRLLLALIQPNEGKVGFRSPDKHFSPIKPTSRRRFSYVPQGNTLLSGTIRDNLLLGHPNASEAQMRQALYLAAADFVDELPLGLDTPCTELGGGLSEGQAQRLCIARALLHPGEVLIFDESTSALDPHTEASIIERIVKHLKGRTLIFVTHRPTVLQHCTQLLQLSRQEKHAHR